MRRSGQGVTGLMLTSLAGVIVLSCFTVVCGLWHSSSRSLRVQIVFGVLGLLGLALMLWPQVRIRKGVRLEQWNSAELGRVRALVEHPFMGVLTWLLFGVFVLLEVVDRPMQGWKLGAACWITFLMLQELNGMRWSLREPQVSEPREMIQGLGPIESDHWGETTR